MKLHIHTDGGARGNPGPAAIGIVIKTEDKRLSKEIIHSYGQKIGDCTNNVAEYSAVLSALGWLVSYLKIVSKKPEHITFYIDSLLVVNQLNGSFKVKNAKLRSLLMEIRIQEQNILIPIHYVHIPRIENNEADELVNLALDSLD